jgi:membrane-bound ClpP family serine protease
MSMKGTTRRTLLTVFVALVDEIALVLILFFVLRRLGIHLPLGFLIALVVALGGGSFMLYRLVTAVLNKKQLTGPEALIGIKGKVITPLNPKGYIKVCGELWEALSIDTSISTDEEVIVVGLEGLTLHVRAQKDANIDSLS